jgi:hypothetical protein
MPAIDTPDRTASNAARPRLPRPGEVAAAALTELRRFHVGLPAAGAAGTSGVELPQDLVPALLHPFRGAAVRGDYPLFVPPESAGAEALPLTFGELVERAMPAGDGARVLRDNARRLVRRVVERLAGAPDASVEARAELAAAGAALRTELALPADGDGRLAASLDELIAAVPAGGRLVPWGAGSALELLRFAALAHLHDARAGFLEEARQTAAGLAAMLGAGRGEAGEGQDVGSFGSRFLDPSRLAGLTEASRGDVRLDAERRAALERARGVLDRFVAAGSAPRPILVVEEGGTVPETAEGWDVVVSAEPYAIAAERFDAAAAELAEVLRALRRARLELAGDYLPERHGPVLERLDWRAFTRRETALLPPVAAVASGTHAADAGLRSLSRLLLSGRPVQALVLVRPAADPGEGGGDVAAYRFEPASLGIGLREAFVQQSSLSRPVHLAAGFSRALSRGRASLHVLDTPPVTAAAGARASIDPWLLAGAAVEGRAHPLFLYDPEAGEGWARRLDFSRNPEPGADWPAGELAAQDDGGGEKALALRFTFADYALLDPAWRDQYRPVPAGLEHEDLVPLVAWLALDAETAGHRVPWIWAVDGSGLLHRLAVGRRLARACRDRRDFWRTLQEMAGVRSEHLERAADAARREARADAEQETAGLEAKHAAELERVRRDAAEEVVDRITSALLEVDVTGLPRLDGGGPRFGLSGDVEQVTAALLAAVGSDPLAAPATADTTPEVAQLTARLLTVLDETPIDV